MTATHHHHSITPRTTTTPPSSSPSSPSHHLVITSNYRRHQHHHRHLHTYRQPSPPKGCDGFFRPIKGACGLPEKAPRVRWFVYRVSTDKGAFGCGSSRDLVRLVLNKLAPKVRLAAIKRSKDIGAFGSAEKPLEGAFVLLNRKGAFGSEFFSRHAKGRKSRARLSGGHYIGHLAVHFRLVSDEGLRGLQVVTRELPLINLHELERLNICSRYGDTRAWVAPGPERQQVAAAGAYEADEAGPAVDEGAQDVPAPTQAPPQPPPAPQPLTMLWKTRRGGGELNSLPLFNLRF
ncbi:hypothetical protein Tco_0787524 [Tanacetum coccineum]